MSSKVGRLLAALALALSVHSSLALRGPDSKKEQPAGIHRRVPRQAAEEKAEEVAAAKKANQTSHLKQTYLIHAMGKDIPCRVVAEFPDARDVQFEFVEGNPKVLNVPLSKLTLISEWVFADENSKWKRRDPRYLKKIAQLAAEMAQRISEQKKINAKENVGPAELMLGDLVEVKLMSSAYPGKVTDMRKDKKGDTYVDVQFKFAPSQPEVKNIPRRRVKKVSLPVYEAASAQLRANPDKAHKGVRLVESMVKLTVDEKALKKLEKQELAEQNGA